MTDPSAAVDEAVRRVVDAFVTLERPEELELELRFGTLGADHRFVPGVTLDFMEVVLGRLHTNASCKMTDWVEHHDTHFPLPRGLSEVLASTQPLRTRTTFNAYTLQIEPRTVQKTKLMDVVLAINQERMAVRICLSREAPIRDELLPMTTDTDLVRIQTRKRVTWAREASAPPPWAYEFSMTWAGKTRSEAEVAKTTRGPTYELEIELDRQTPYVLAHEPLYLARSLLCKARDFLERDATFRVVRESDRRLSDERCSDTQATDRP